MAQQAIDSALYHTVRTLSETIGPRPVGSSANRQAAAYLRRQLQAAGLEVEMQPYACPDWTLDQAALLLDGTPLTFAANPYSPACELTLPCTPLGTLEELQQADLHGRMALLYGALAARGLLPPYAAYSDAPDPLAALLIEKAPAAVLMAQTWPGSTAPLIEDWTFPIPSATLTPESALRLLKNPAGELHLTIASRREESQTANLVACLPGRGAKSVLVCAHFDTHPGGPGAMDNAGGAAVVLELARRQAAEAVGELGLEFVFFSGEETGGTDFDAYLAQRGGSLAHLAGCLNIDGVGQLGSTASLTFLGEETPLAAALRAVPPAHGPAVWVEPWYESDHSLFAMRGIPAAAVSSVGFARVHDTPADTLDWIDPHRLAEAYYLARAALGTLLGELRENIKQ